MLGFSPFSWSGTPANIDQGKKGSDVMFGSIFSNIDSANFRYVCFHRYDEVIDQIITNNREIISKLQRNEPTNMTNLPSSIPVPLVVDCALKVTSLMIHKCFI